MTADELAAAVGAAAAEELRHALDRIRHCVGQLSQEQCWHRTAPGLNSIGNLLTHLCGNLRQWMLSGLGGAPDVRYRPAEFAELDPVPPVELLRELEAIVEQVIDVLQCQTADDWTRVRRIQGYDVTGLQALFNTIPHFRGHAQEIVHMTRLRLGNAYHFAWVPATPEEGAAS